ncbi:hypothetical protein D9M71_304700 [compost metagenome]
MHAELLAVALGAICHVGHQIRVASRCGQCRHPVVVGDQVVEVRSRLDDFWPFHQQRHAMAAFVGSALLAVKRRSAAIRPAEFLGSVIGRVYDDGVVGNAQVIQLFQQLADLPVVLDHAIRVQANPRLALGLFLQVGPDMHARTVEPDEKRLVGFVRLVDEVLGGLHQFVVDGFHTLARQGTGVFDLAVSERMDHPTWAVLFAKLRIFGVVVGFRFFFGIHVVQVAEELIKAMVGRQVPVAVAQVVLAELAGGVALLLHRITDGRRPIGDAMLGAGHADGQQTGAKRMLAQDERRTPGGAGLLAVGMSEQCAFFADAVDVGSFVAHHALVVGTEVKDADVVAEDHQDVRFVGGLSTE